MLNLTKREHDEQSSPSSAVLSGHLFKNTAEPATFQFALESSDTHTHTRHNNGYTSAVFHYSGYKAHLFDIQQASSKHTHSFTSSHRASLSIPSDADTRLLSGRMLDKREGWDGEQEEADRWKDTADETQRGWEAVSWTPGGRRGAMRKAKAAEIFMVRRSDGDGDGEGGARLAYLPSCHADCLVTPPVNQAACQSTEQTLSQVVHLLSEASRTQTPSLPSTSATNARSQSHLHTHTHFLTHS